MQKPKVVIIGAGFAGLAAMKELKGKAEITLIDKNKDNVFLPGLKKYAFGLLQDKDVLVSLKQAVKKHKAVFIQATVKEIKTQKKEVVLPKKTIPYDYLVITTGADAIREENRLVFWNKEDAQQIRDKKKSIKKIIIVGGGVLGSEIAAHFRDYTTAEITIIESGSRLVKELPEKVSGKVEAYLIKERVSIFFNNRVKKATATQVDTGDKKISADAVLWTVGASAQNILSKEKSVMVDEYLQVEKNIFGAGDCIAAKNGERYIKRVPSAEKQGKIAGYNILADIEGGERKKYEEATLPTLIALGKKPLLHITIKEKNIVWQSSILQLLARFFLKKHHNTYE